MYTVVASARTRVRTGQRMLESLNEVSILWSVSKGMYDKRAHTSFFNDLSLKNEVCALLSYMPLLTLHRIETSFKDSNIRWPVRTRVLADATTVYMCPHPTMCCDTDGYFSISGLRRHTKTHAPDPNIPPPPFSLEGLATNTSHSSTPPQQVHMGEDVDLDFFQAPPLFEGEEDDIEFFYGNISDFQTAAQLHLDVLANPPGTSHQTPPEDLVQCIQAVSTYLFYQSNPCR